MAAFIASGLLFAPLTERSNSLRWGLQRRFLSSFDWSGNGMKLLKSMNDYQQSGADVFIPNSWSLCRGTLSVMSSSCNRSSTAHGSAKRLIQKIFTQVELCWSDRGLKEQLCCLTNISQIGPTPSTSV